MFGVWFVIIVVLSVLIFFPGGLVMYLVCFGVLGCYLICMRVRGVAVVLGFGFAFCIGV